MPTREDICAMMALNVETNFPYHFPGSVRICDAEER